MVNEIIRFKYPVSIVMPVSNEGFIIEQTITEWIDDVFQYLPPGSEMLFDEAGSIDNTKDILVRLSKLHPFIKVEYHETRDGFANAVHRLYSRASCPFVMYTDSDGQYKATEFWKAAKFIDSYDIVHGIKIEHNDPWCRKLLSFGFDKIVKLMFHIKFSDINAGFLLINNMTLKKLLPDLKHMKVMINSELMLLAMRNGYKIKEIDVIHLKRQFGNSKWLSIFSIIKISVDVILPLIRIKKSWKSNDLKSSKR
jgi:hypothetical protein